MEDLNSLTHLELHGVLSEILADIYVALLEVHALLSKTEVFDPELSMQLMEQARSYLEIASKLVRGSLNELGLSNEVIDSLLRAYLKALNDE